MKKVCALHSTREGTKRQRPTLPAIEVTAARHTPLAQEYEPSSLDRLAKGGIYFALFSFDDRAAAQKMVADAWLKIVVFDC